jgi:hypothetical protein
LYCSWINSLSELFVRMDPLGNRSAEKSSVAQVIEGG